MNKGNGALLRDIRNIKRNTGLIQSPQEIITSVKQLKKVRSSQQININTFMDVLILNLIRIKMKRSETLMKNQKFMKPKSKRTIKSFNN